MKLHQNRIMFELVKSHVEGTLASGENGLPFRTFRDDRQLEYQREIVGDGHLLCPLFCFDHFVVVFPFPLFGLLVLDDFGQNNILHF